MSDRFRDGMLAYADRQARETALGKFGIITGVDNKNSLAKVTIMPEGIQTGWLPVIIPMAASGITMRVGLTPGMHAYLSPQEGSADGYVIVGVYHNTINPAPQGPDNIDGGPVDLKDGELLITTKGTTIRIGSDGSVLIKAANEIRLQATKIRSKGSWDHAGDLNITGHKTITGNMDITGSVTASGDIKAGSISLKTHKHVGVQTGGGTSGLPV